MLPGSASDRKASRFFSRATRPTQRNSGRGSSGRKSRGPGAKRRASTPRDHTCRLPRPRRATMSRTVGVGTRTRCDGRWNQRR
ncbi:Uncharacterised protein [Bordetella pertussis]|nr:Uncharacterised protein [Bordetella pertussis]